MPLKNIKEINHAGLYPETRYRVPAIRSGSVGTGFSDKERKQNWNNEIGNVVTISCESIIKDKRNNKKHSLYLPRFDEIRRDRNNAQTLKDMQQR